MGNVEGGAVRITAQYTDEETGALVDPATASVKVRQPDGQLVAYDWTGGGGDTLQKTADSTGSFYIDLEGLEAGVYWARAESTQPNTASEQKFAVEGSRVL